jgi:hypothetical protein
MSASMPEAEVLLPQAVESNGNFEKLRPFELITAVHSVPRGFVSDLHIHHH